MDYRKTYNTVVEQLHNRYSGVSSGIKYHSYNGIEYKQCWPNQQHGYAPMEYVRHIESGGKVVEEVGPNGSINYVY